MSGLHSSLAFSIREHFELYRQEELCIPKLPLLPRLEPHPRKLWVGIQIEKMPGYHLEAKSTLETVLNRVECENELGQRVSVESLLFLS